MPANECPFDDSFEDSMIASMTVDNNDGNTGAVDDGDDVFAQLFSADIDDERTLLRLSADELLPHIVLNFDEFCGRRANGSTDSHFEYVLGLTHLMQKLVQIEDNVVDLWIKSSKQSRNCLLTAIFRFIPNCGLEVCSPKVVDLCSIDHKIRMSFYEFLCFSVCQLMITLSANQMPFVEQTLFENLLSEDCIRHQLASDVLCFISRFNESSALCYHFCSLLMTMSSHIDHRLVPNTTSLLNRLLPFLKPSELQYLISDYDLIKHSKTWSLLNVSLVLSLQEITKTVDRYQTFIAEGRPLTTHDLNLMSNLLTTRAVDDKTRENTFITILDNFSQSNDCKLNTHFIDLLTVLTPKRFNDLNVLKITAKFTDIFKQKTLDLRLTDKILMFLVRLSNVKISEGFEKSVVKMITTSMNHLFSNHHNFYAKYLTLKAMKTISLKSKRIAIITECCKDNQTLKQQFTHYITIIRRNQLMDKNVIKTYLQNTIALEVKPRRYGRSDDNSSPMNAKKKNKKRRKIVDESDEDFDDSFDVMLEAMEEGFNGADTQ